jgi:hypothetical protein
LSNDESPLVICELSNQSFRIFGGYRALPAVLVACRERWIPMQSQPLQAVDKDGTVVTVRRFVRVLGVSGDWFDRLPVDERANVESMVGEVFLVEEIDEYGQPWVRRSWPADAEGTCRSHSIALEPDDMVLVPNHEPLG